MSVRTPLAQDDFSSLDLAVSQDAKTLPLDGYCAGDSTIERVLKSESPCDNQMSSLAAGCQTGVTGPESVSRSYNIQSDLHILNEVPRAIWISKFDAADTRFVWGNSAALRLWNKPSLTAFTSTDIMSGRSITMQIMHQRIYQDVQV